MIFTKKLWEGCFCAAPEGSVGWFKQNLVSEKGRARRFILEVGGDVF